MECNDNPSKKEENSADYFLQNWIKFNKRYSCKSSL